MVVVVYIIRCIDFGIIDRSVSRTLPHGRISDFRRRTRGTQKYKRTFGHLFFINIRVQTPTIRFDSWNLICSKTLTFLFFIFFSKRRDVATAAAGSFWFYFTRSFGSLVSFWIRINVINSPRDGAKFGIVLQTITPSIPSHDRRLVRVLIVRFGIAYAHRHSINVLCRLNYPVSPKRMKS